VISAGVTATETTGAATTLTELGDPRTSDDYVLCAYDGSGVRFSVLAAAGGSCGNAPCWSAVATRGYVYKDALLTPLGLQKLLLKSGGDGKALALAAGKGANLPAFGQPLPLPLRVQLQAKNGSCWDATYSAAGLKRNDAAQFSATSD